MAGGVTSRHGASARWPIRWRKVSTLIWSEPLTTSSACHQPASPQLEQEQGLLPFYVDEGQWAREPRGGTGEGRDT